MWTKLLFLAVLVQQSVTSMPFKDQCVKTHNKFRAIHQAPPVKWSSELENMATRWADYLARENKAQHESHSEISDNLYITGNRPKEPCKEATEAFYREVSHYNYDQPLANWAKTGHFTQVVWKATKEIGAAQAIRNDSNLIVVVKYKPAGNMMIASYYKANVLPPNGGPATNCACVLVALMFAAVSTLVYSF